MLEVIIGLVISIITQFAKKSGIEAKWIVLVLSLVAGAGYFIMKYAFGDELNVVWNKVLEVYGVSQIIYNYAIKYFEKNE